MDVIKSISDSVTLVAELISAIEEAMKKGGGVIAEVEAIASDAEVVAALKALISDIKGA